MSSIAILSSLTTHHCNLQHVLHVHCNLWCLLLVHCKLPQDPGKPIAIDAGSKSSIANQNHQMVNIAACNVFSKCIAMKIQLNRSHCNSNSPKYSGCNQQSLSELHCNHKQSANSPLQPATCALCLLKCTTRSRQVIQMSHHCNLWCLLLVHCKLPQDAGKPIAINAGSKSSIANQNGHRMHHQSSQRLNKPHCKSEPCAPCPLQCTTRSRQVIQTPQ